MTQEEKIDYIFKSVQAVNKALDFDPQDDGGCPPDAIEKLKNYKG